jgi:hypothetical protein
VIRKKLNNNSIIREENRFKKNQKKDDKNKKKKIDHPSFYRYWDDYTLNYKHKTSNHRMGEWIASLIMSTLVSEGHIMRMSYFQHLFMNKMALKILLQHLIFLLIFIERKLKQWNLKD